MSEELEGFSVSTEPAASAMEEDISAAPTPAAAAPKDSAEHEDTTIWDNPDVASRLNVNANNDALTTLTQQAYQELYSPALANESAAPVTQAGRDNHEAEKDKKREEKERHIEESQERERRHQEWMSKDHQMGDLQMSGADLEKLMTFAKNPEMQKKIESLLKAKGVDKKTIDKGQSEMNEFIKLKEKEKEEGLTKQEQLRLQQINESKEFKVYSKESADFAVESGVKLSFQEAGSAIAARSSENVSTRNDAKSKIRDLQANLTSENVSNFQNAQSENRDGIDLTTSSKHFVVASARDVLPPTVALTEKYNLYAGGVGATSVHSSLDMDGMQQEENMTANSTAIVSEQNKVAAAQMVVASL